MKKILIFVMVGVIALYGSNSVQAKSIRPKYDEYFDAPEPDFSEIDSSEEISIQQEMDYVSMSLLSCPSEDQYETNDSFDLATKKYHYSDL
jgi:tRNA U34 5-carboxymethylaminomethyl modifying enzyme MnmG/GidA